MERRVEGALSDGKRVGRGLLDPSRDGITVGGPPTQGLEDEKVKGSAEDVETRGLFDGLLRSPFSCLSMIGRQRVSEGC
jgi:hypothetical protein